MKKIFFTLILMALAHFYEARILSVAEPYSGHFIQTKQSGINRAKMSQTGRDLADTFTQQESSKGQESEPIMTAHVDYPFLGLVNLGNGEYDFEID